MDRELQEGIRINWQGEQESERNSSWGALQYYLNQTPIKASERPEALEVRVEADLWRSGGTLFLRPVSTVRAANSSQSVVLGQERQSMGDIRKVWTDNRITVLCPPGQVQAFERSNWERRLGARFDEILENSRGRLVWAFMTETPPIRSLARLSQRWPLLVFFLDYEIQRNRVKGLAKAKAGKLENYEIHC